MCVVEGLANISVNRIAVEYSSRVNVFSVHCSLFILLVFSDGGGRCATGEGWQEVMLHAGTDEHFSIRRCVDPHAEQRERALLEKRPALFQSLNLCHPPLLAQLYPNDTQRGGHGACSCGTILARPYFITFIFFCSFLVLSPDPFDECTCSVLLCFALCDVNMFCFIPQ